MKNAEFMQKISSHHDLFHYQRKRLIASLNQVDDEARVLDLIEAFFDAKSVYSHCVCADLQRFDCADGLQCFLSLMGLH